MTILDFKIVKLPIKPKKEDYFKAAVLYNLTGEKINFSTSEKSTFDDANIVRIIKYAIPGYNSYLMSLEIKSNISEAIIEDENLSLNEKVMRIADSIKKYINIEIIKNKMIISNAGVDGSVWNFPKYRNKLVYSTADKLYFMDVNGKKFTWY